jgi:hypothetical protein
MFIRAKKRDDKVYLQIVENQRVNGKVVQRVHYTLGRLDLMQKTGELESLLKSGQRFSEKLIVLDALAKGECTTTQTHKIGPTLLFEKLWQECGIASIIKTFLHNRRYDFPVERAIFITVVHRLMCSGSDRNAEKWMQQYAWKENPQLDLHHFYRSMAFLGLPGPHQNEQNTTPKGLTPRCLKDDIEESIYALRRTLLSNLSLVFLDTTAIYFEGDAITPLRQRGYSKDGRPDAPQIVVAVVLDDEGNPVCSEILPGNTTDVKTLIPVAKRIKERFGIEQVCIVADRGMISASTIESLEQMGWLYILGVRMHRLLEVKNEVLSHPGRFAQIFSEREKSGDPAPLEVKEVRIEDRRYIVCRNAEEARKDRHDREAIVAALKEQLKQGDKSLVGNKGYRRYLKGSKNHFVVDEEKVQQDARFDGKWVLQTNTDLGAWEVAIQYKQLWTVEEIFRTMKTTLATRPIFHHCDENVRGHVFCSFLALVLRKALQDKLAEKKYELEWNDIISDIDRLQEVSVTHNDKKFVLRTEVCGVAGKVFAAAGVALPPVLRQN